MPTFDNLLHQPLLFGLLLLAAFIVGMSKGGLSTLGMLAVPILSIFMSPLLAAVLLLPIYILSDVVGVYLYRHEFSRENIKLLIPAGLCGVVLGWATASIVSDQVVSLLIGMMGVTFCLYSWFVKKADAPVSQPSLGKGMFWGTLTGFTSFITHAGGPPFQIYVLPQKLPKMVFAGTVTVVFAVINMAKVIPYYSLHPQTMDTFKVALVLLPAAAIGTAAGRFITERLPTKWFFRFVQVALFLVSVRLVWASF
uniref:Probable membrane transporter protein n=1 Tax=uncultured Thiotrichaceae bacterium TaxID=298394 RepID=A0A6S6SJJ7_9GAMM|nr:MAG: FIG00761799: membrane protein [uncultured Thiotrichaceae bacterium]